MARDMAVHIFSYTAFEICVLGSHSSPKTDAGRMLNRRFAAAAAVFVRCAWHTTGQIDGRTDTREMLYASALDAASGITGREREYKKMNIRVSKIKQTESSNNYQLLDWKVHAILANC